MIRRVKLYIQCASLLLAIAMASPAAAGDVYSGMSDTAQQTAENVIDSLENSGYKIVSVKRTLLRRLRITAVNGAHTREVIVTRTSGMIKRDKVIKVARTGGKRSKSDVNDAVRTSAISETVKGDDAERTSSFSDKESSFSDSDREKSSDSDSADGGADSGGSNDKESGDKVSDR